MSVIDRAMMQAYSGPRTAMILASFERLRGVPLARNEGELWEAPFAVVAHDTGEPARFFYANAAALALFFHAARDFAGMESRLSAPSEYREERAEMLAGLQRAPLVTGYSGIRVDSEGRQFRIRDATLWNVTDEAGAPHGQAAMIPRWDFL